MEDYHSILHAPRTALDADVRIPHRKRSLLDRIHSNDEEEAGTIATVYAALSDPGRRKKYDADLLDEESPSRISAYMVNSYQTLNPNPFLVLGLEPSTLYIAEICSEAIELTL